MSAPISSTTWPSRWPPFGEVPVSVAPAPATDSRWHTPGRSAVRDYLEVLVAVAAVTLAGWFVPVTYRAFGSVYLLVVIALSLRVGRAPALFAAVISALMWNYVFMPPRLSFSVLHLEDSLMLGTYLLVALISGQLMARLRLQERVERERERRATALYKLTRALTSAHTLDDALAAALREADTIFEARTTVLIADDLGLLEPHPAGTFPLTLRERAVAEWAAAHRAPAGRFTGTLASAEGLCLPVFRGDAMLGVFVLGAPAGWEEFPPGLREVAEAFAAQLALLVERENLRRAGEREKLLAESDRLHRTLLDSVSHELKTPLAVLRAAGEKLANDDGAKRASLALEIRTASRRLDHLVGNLLNQTRLEAGGVRARLDWCDVRDILHAARRAVDEALAGREVTTAIAPDTPLVLADAPLLEHAVANLLLNACRHTPASTPIQVAAGVERVGGISRIFLRVSDRGAGIPGDMREHLFQKFRRSAGAGPGGLGLGLSIVRGFVEAHGGTVMAGDNPGGGARFTIHLPYRAHGSVPDDEP